MLTAKLGHPASYTFDHMIRYVFFPLNTQSLNYYQQVCHCPMEKYLRSLQIYVLYHQGYNLRVYNPSPLPFPESVCHRNLQQPRLQGIKHFLVAYSSQRFQQVQPLLRRTRFVLTHQPHYSQDGSIRQSPDGKFRCTGYPKVRSLPECEKKFKEAKERTERLFHPEDHDTRFPSR